ncbi:YtrH family sporulation protein [Tepidibacillus infernus]|uniref:Sporulation protein n=1 Tax=Tepidibacillus decaturensis TaxID=1413211 RepID=A0A135L1R9_9BACI|nr:MULTISPECIES: YtrH family sporulation protein [Tepidibacillus]KXG42819.1 sporulation protein [Tepidibacillus decaturensis]GBF11764.1 sporulation membrane protein YtrH [Tepidibacillus sp. HK-1]
MQEFIRNLFMNYFVAFGVMIGGSLFGGLGALFTKQPPIHTMIDLSDKLRIWALVVALGGTFDSFKILETGVLGGDLSPMMKQIIYIIMGLAGAYSGKLVIVLLAKGDITS